MRGLDTKLTANEQLRKKAEKAVAIAGEVNSLKIIVAIQKDEIEALKTVVIGLDRRLKELEGPAETKGKKVKANGSIPSSE